MIARCDITICFVCVNCQTWNDMNKIKMFC